MVPGTWGGNGTNGYTNQAGTLITGGGSRLATIADKVSLALAGVNIGSKLGAGIDGLLYDLDPQWWEDTNLLQDGTGRSRCRKNIMRTGISPWITI